MRLPKLFLATLTASGSALAIVDPTAPATPCVPPRTPASPLPSLIAEGCEFATDITPAVCADYLAQQIPLAQTQNCGNQTEAYAYCLSQDGTTPTTCASFDPSGGGGQNCSEDALTTYGYCGDGLGWFAAGDPVDLVQCLFFQLGLCGPEDGIGHYNGDEFEGDVGDCPLAAYVPGCGVVSPGSASSSNSVVEAAPTTSTIQATAAVTTTSLPSGSPSDDPTFNLRLNGSDTFVAPLGFTTTDPTEAETFFLRASELFTTDGLQLQTSPGDDDDDDENTVQAMVFAGLDNTMSLPIQTAFGLVTQGVDPPKKRTVGEAKGRRQLVGLTVLLWVNALFDAPGTTARFCVLDGLVYAVFQSPGDNPDFDTSCETVLLTVSYLDSSASSTSCDCTDTAASSAVATPNAATTSTIDGNTASSAESTAAATFSSGATTSIVQMATSEPTTSEATTVTATTSTESSRNTFATSIVIQATTTGLNMTACPLGQTLVEFTTVRAI